MSDPRDNDAYRDPYNPDPNNRDPNLPPPEERRRSAVSPLVWILLLLALAALAWWFYNRSVQTGIDTTAPPVSETPAVTSSEEAAAAAESARAEAREREQARTEQRRDRERERARERAAARVPRDRVVSPVARVQPEYPAAALRAREEGTVLVRVQVDADGNPTDVSVARRSGSRELDRAAMQAVRKWRFEPAIAGGKPVASTAEVPVDFTLGNQ